MYFFFFCNVLKFNGDASQFWVDTFDYLSFKLDDQCMMQLINIYCKELWILARSKFADLLQAK